MPIACRQGQRGLRRQIQQIRQLKKRYEGLAIFSSLLLGFGDACYNTQTISLLGGVYPNEAGPAFAIFKFVQCVAAAAGFLYAGYIPLYWHCGMLWAVGLIGTLLFIKIDIQTKKKEVLRAQTKAEEATEVTKDNYDKLSNSSRKSSDSN